MSKVTKEDIVANAWALKVDLTDSEVDYCVDEVNKFFAKRPELDCNYIDENCVALEPLRYVNENVVNVFSATEENIADTEDILSNTLDREGNYIKIPKVLK